MWRQLFQ